MRRKDHHIPDAVYIPLVRSFFREGRSLLIGSAIVTIGMLASYLKSQQWPFIACAVAFLLLSIIRFVGVYQFNNRSAAVLTRKTAARWEKFYIFGACASVALLGLWCHLAFALDAGPFVQLAGFSLTIGYIIGIFGRNFANAYFVILQSLAAWLPIVAALLLYGDAYYWLLAALLTLLFVGLTFIAGQARTILMEAIHARLKAETARARALHMVGKLRQSMQSEAAAIARRDEHMRFLATMSHEIRTPLNGIVGALDLISTSRSEKIPTLVEAATSSADALLEIVSDVLDLSKLEYGLSNAGTTDFAPLDLMNFVARALDPIARGKGLRFATSVGDNVPVQLIGEHAKIRQILINLAGNALKYTDHGSVRLELSWLATEHRIAIEVRDTGQGIAPGDIGRIFDPFFTSTTRSIDRPQSSGLGLTIVKKTLESIAGTITCASELGRGTTFSLTIPVEIGVEPEANPVAPIARPVPELAAPAAILLVEDNDTNAMIVEYMLEDSAHRVERASGGMEAVTMAHNRFYDLIFMDISMPDIDGVEACARIRKSRKGRRSKIIALTANAVAGDKERYLSAGFDGYLSKPVRQKDLIDTINQALASTPSTTIGASNDRAANNEGAAKNDEPARNDERARSERHARRNDEIDLRAFNALIGSRSPDKVCQLLSVFETELIKIQQGLVQACSRRDVTSAEQAFHTISGMSGVIGATALQQDCNEFERACRDGTLPSARRQARLQQRIARTIAEARTLAAGYVNAGVNFHRLAGVKVHH